MSGYDVGQLMLLGAGVVGVLAATWRLGWQQRHQEARRERQEARAEVARLRGLLYAQRTAASRTIARHRESWFVAGVLAERDALLGTGSVDSASTASGPPPLVMLSEAGAVDEVYRVLRAARERGQR